MKTKQHHDLVKDTEIFGVSLSLLISRANEICYNAIWSK